MNVQFLIGGCAVSLACAGLILFLLRPLTRRPGSPLTVLPHDLGTSSSAGLILASVLGLYLELLLIRWISSEIRIFAYFKNFVLIACFLGFGLGCYLTRRAISILMLGVPVLFFSAAICLPWPPLRRLIDALPPLLGASSDIYIFEMGTANVTGSAITGLLIAALIALPLFILIAITFIPIGQLVGWYLETAPNGIRAYSWNVLASLAGIALYTALCFADQPPMVWMLVGCGIAVALFWRAPWPRWATLIAFVAAAILMLFQDTDRARVYWSPYQKLAVRPNLLDGKVVGYSLETKGSWYQNVLNLSPDFIKAHPEVIGGLPPDLNAYNLPYRFAPRPANVLVLGSGMGNDVAAALRNGSGAITAVEIDPLIVKLGRALHPENPYGSPRVRIIVDDARSYVQNSAEQYDLIVFSLLDSHTTASHFTNIRIDNYVYTREAFAAAKRLLRPNGIFIVKFQVEFRPWIAGRLHELLTDAFGFQPLQLEATAGYRSWGRFFITGSKQRILAALADPRLRAYVRSRVGMPMEAVAMTTDDWPYFYQRNPGLPMSVATVSLLLIAISLLAAQRIGLGFNQLRFEFFLLGAGFMLLEAQIISRMALLFGTTWVVNSVVVAVLLILIVAANAIVAARPRTSVELAYAGIIACVAINYLVPIQALFYRSFFVRATVATLILCLPVFFAGIVFVRRFASAGFAAEAIGSNLLGALAGGVAESLSLWLGFRALLGVVAALYLGAWLAGRLEPTSSPKLPVEI